VGLMSQNGSIPGALLFKYRFPSEYWPYCQRRKKLFHGRHRYIKIQSVSPLVDFTGLIIEFRD